MSMMHMCVSPVSCARRAEDRNQMCSHAADDVTMIMAGATAAAGN